METTSVNPIDIENPVVTKEKKKRPQKYYRKLSFSTDSELDLVEKEMDKKERRIVGNRISARRSRENRKIYIQSCKDKIASLEKECEELKKASYTNSVKTNYAQLYHEAIETVETTQTAFEKLFVDYSNILEERNRLLKFQSQFHLQSHLESLEVAEYCTCKAEGEFCSITVDFEKVTRCDIQVEQLQST
jgi:hypothetical protein